MTVKVGIIDDSLIVRSKLTKLINSEPGFQVVGSAENPFSGRELVLEEEPDVLTLDVEMPRLDGLSFLESLMENYPMPVVMVSSFTSKTSEKGIKALELGAVEVVHKTAGDSEQSIDQLKEELIEKLKIAAEAKITKDTKISAESEPTKTELDSEIDFLDSTRLIVIGASTGGTRVLLELFGHFPPATPPILICQHMPPLFTKKFSQHLDEKTEISVREAAGSELVGNSTALLAPGDRHMVVTGGHQAEGVPVGLNQDEKVNYQRPSVDVLFESAARHAGADTLGIILSGMGADGVEGAQQLAEAGGEIIVQDEASSTVYGMPARVKETVDSAREFNLEQLAALFSKLKIAD